MPSEVLVAHSLAEIHLFLMATPCPTCKQGPLRDSGGGALDRSVDPSAVPMTATCDACHTVSKYVFQLPKGPDPAEADDVAAINPTDEPSHIIDVAQWVTLFRMLTEAGDRATDRTRGRHRKIEAAHCLDEAIKFYDEVGNDLPPIEAFFHDASRRRLRDHPEQFSKQRLLNLRAELPSPASRRRAPSSSRKRWFRRQN